MTTSARVKLEGFLIKLDLAYEEVGESMWVINDEPSGLVGLVVYAEDELVTIRANVMQIPDADRESLFEELLRFNAEMVHGAYAIEERDIVLLDTMELQTMDFEELQASFDSFGLALAQHYSHLAKYRKAT